MKSKITIRGNQNGAPVSRQESVIGEATHAGRFEVDLMALGGLLLRRRRWRVGIVGGVGLLTAALMLSTPNMYTSRATILPSGKSNSFSALRAMAGLGDGLRLADENSSALFPLILRSNLVRDAVLAKRYSFAFGREHLDMTLPEYVGNNDPGRLRAALAGMTTVSSNTRTGEITISVETKHPEFSRAVVQEYLNQLETYNLHKRRSVAKNSERYLARQLDKAESALEEAENQLEQFRRTNASWSETGSPEILTRLGRLGREVEIRSAAYLLLQKQYELAKLEAQKDVPIVRILDQPSLPTLKSGPFRTITVLSAVGVTLALVVLGIIVLDLVKQAIQGSNKSSYEQWTEDLHSTFPRTTKLWTEAREKFKRNAISVDG